MSIVKFRLVLTVPYTTEKLHTESHFIGLRDIYSSHLPRVGEYIETDYLPLPDFEECVVTKVRNRPVCVYGPDCVDLFKSYEWPPHWVEARLIGKIENVKKVYQTLVASDEAEEKDRHWEYGGDN